MKLLQQKRQRIVENLIGYNSKSVVRFISKIVLYEGVQHEYELIQYSINNKAIVKAFSHWQNIPIQALIVVGKYPIFIGSRLLVNLINYEDNLIRQLGNFSKINKIMVDVKQMAETMEVILPTNYFSLFTTVTDIHRVYDRLVTRFNRWAHYRIVRRPNRSKVVSKIENIIFPECPLGNSEYIEQIMCSYDLISEGVTMHHCVGGYIQQARSDLSFFYKIFEPERGTIKLSIIGKKVRIEEFKLVCNKSPSEKSQFAIRQWIKDS